MPSTPSVNFPDQLWRSEDFSEFALELSVISNQMKYLDLEWQQNTEKYILQKYITQNFYKICQSMASGDQLEGLHLNKNPIIKKFLEDLQISQRSNRTAWYHVFPQEYHDVLEELFLECEKQELLVIKLDDVPMSKALKLPQYQIPLTQYIMNYFQDTRPLDKEAMFFFITIFGILSALLVTSLYFYLCSFWIIGFLPHGFISFVIGCLLSDAFSESRAVDDFIRSHDPKWNQRKVLSELATVLKWFSQSEPRRLSVLVPPFLITYFFIPTESFSTSLFSLACWVLSHIPFLISIFFIYLVFVFLNYFVSCHHQTDSNKRLIGLLVVTLGPPITLITFFFTTFLFFYISSIRFIGFIFYMFIAILKSVFLSKCWDEYNMSSNFSDYSKIRHFLDSDDRRCSLLIILNLIIYFFVPMTAISGFMYQCALYMCSKTIQVLEALLVLSVITTLSKYLPDTIHPVTITF